MRAPRPRPVPCFASAPLLPSQDDPDPNIGVLAELLRQAFEQSPVSTVVYDAGGRPLAVNPAFERLWGVGIADVPPGYSVLVDPQLEAAGVIPLLRRAFGLDGAHDDQGDGEAVTLPPLRYDMPVTSGKGRTVWTQAHAYPVRDAAGSIERVVLTQTDVTERLRLMEAERAARAAAEQSSTQLAAVLDALPDAAAVYDTEWRYVYINPAARALHVELLTPAGVPAEEAGGYAMGRVAWEVFPWLVGTRLESESLRAVAERRSVEYVEHIASLDRWYETRIIPTAAGAMSLNRDVTAQYVAQAERESLLTRERVAREAAEAANRSKAEFLATMSHELRTPLNAIQGHAQLIELGVHGAITSAQREALARIDRAQRHLLGMINDILNYARLESGQVEYELEPVSLGDVVREVTSMLEPQMRAKALVMQVVLPPDEGTRPVMARADREKFVQILLNLLSNAVKFTGGGGTVTVTVAEEGAYGALRVSDTGIGIPANRIEAVFEPFVQVRAPEQSRAGRISDGVGLGLAISRDLARGMGGDLTAESLLGQGSTFTLTLPLA